LHSNAIGPHRARQSSFQAGAVAASFEGPPSPPLQVGSQVGFLCTVEPETFGIKFGKIEAKARIIVPNEIDNLFPTKNPNRHVQERKTARSILLTHFFAFSRTLSESRASSLSFGWACRYAQMSSQSSNSNVVVDLGLRSRARISLRRLSASAWFRLRHNGTRESAVREAVSSLVRAIRSKSSP
jgi:hypothetical protein